MNDLLIPNPAVRYILFQRTDYLAGAKSRLRARSERYLPRSIYNGQILLEAALRRNAVKKLYRQDMFREYEIIKPFLPDRCEHVLDIGCGVAGIDAVLNFHYANANMRFSLLDKTAVSRKVFYGFETTGAFYNSLDVARELLLHNGITSDQVQLVEAGKTASITNSPSVDLAVSLISWGYHYPVTTYLELVKETLSPHGILILDVRRDTDGTKILNDTFSRCEIVDEDTKRIRLCCYN